MSITKAADALLRRIVPEVRAGACVPADICGCYFHHYGCYLGRRTAFYQYKRYDCGGSCATWTSTVCRRVQTSYPCD